MQCSHTVRHGGACPGHLRTAVAARMAGTSTAMTVSAIVEINSRRLGDGALRHHADQMRAIFGTGMDIAIEIRVGLLHSRDRIR